MWFMATVLSTTALDREEKGKKTVVLLNCMGEETEAQSRVRTCSRTYTFNCL